MKTLFSMTKILAMAVAMFAFASGAWAEHDGDNVAHEGDEVTDTEVIGDEEVIGEDGNIDDTGVVGDGEEVVGGEEGSGDELIYMTGVGGEEPIENLEDGAPVSVDDQDVTNIYDSEGNLVGAYRGQEGGVEEVDMDVLMVQSGVSGGAGITLADTAADQAGLDGANGMSLDVVDSNQADFAAPVDVAIVESGASVGATNGGTATRINGGHLSAGSQQ